MAMKKMTDADKAKAKIKDTTKTVTKSGRTITTSVSSSYPKKLVPGSMASNSKVAEIKPVKKASTKYSPAPMSAAAKKKAALRGKITGLSAKFPAEFKLQKINPSLPKAKKK
jgi:hypothetical protein